MAKFEVPILPIDKVENHPNADRLSLNHIRGYVVVSNKDEDGHHRYRPGQLVAYIPENAIVPESVLRRRGYWDDKKCKGFLGGDHGNIVGPINLRGVLSRGLVFPTHGGSPSYLESREGHNRIVNVGDNVIHFLEITKHEERFLEKYDGEALGYKIPYEIEDLRKFPDLIKGSVVVTEMLHGILCIIGYNRGLDNPWIVTSGPLGTEGIRIRDDNIYLQTAQPIWESINRYRKEMPGIEEFYLFGEIIGPGIQDLIYGLEATEFRAIDVKMKFMGSSVGGSIPAGFVGIRKYELFKWLNVATVPIVWGGEYDFKTIEQLANSPSSLGGGLRKGVVITSEDESLVENRRPILKLLSDKFLLRSRGTNFK